MDLNQLYFDHQLLLMRAATSPASAGAAVHLCQAAGIARQIGDLQRAKGANAHTYWIEQAANDHACPEATSACEVAA